MAFWTHYGMWDDAGLRVTGPWGNVIYRLSDAAEARLRNGAAEPSGEARGERPGVHDERGTGLVDVGR